MTKEEAKHWADIFTAVSEGKTIECKTGNELKWNHVNIESHDFWLNHPAMYRIAPEPKYIPFTFDDTPVFFKRLLKRKGKLFDGYWEIYNISPDKLKLSLSKDNCIEVSYDSLFKDWEFEDGTPFGKEVRDES